jgi:hypothetical protein
MNFEDLHRERFGPPPPTVSQLQARRAELADLQHRDPDIVRAYVARIGGRVCDLSPARLDIIATYAPRNGDPVGRR